MIYDWQNDPFAHPGRVVCADSGRVIPFVFWLDTEAGEYERYDLDETREPTAFRVAPDHRGIVTVRGRGRVRFEPLEPFADEPVLVEVRP